MDTTKLTRQQLQALADYLLHITTDPGVKLRWGSRLREEIRLQLQKGQMPTGYRVDWLRNTRAALVETLQREAQAFNEKYRHDCISVSDLADALSTALHQLKTASEREDARQALD